MNRVQALYIKIEEIEVTINIFFNSRATFRARIWRALKELHDKDIQFYDVFYNEVKGGW